MGRVWGARRNNASTKANLRPHVQLLDIELTFKLKSVKKLKVSLKIIITELSTTKLRSILYQSGSEDFGL